MKIVCISDTHLVVREGAVLDFPDGDIIIHSGDFCNSGARYDLTSYLPFLEECLIKYTHVVQIAGNHDWVCQLSEDYAKEIFHHLGPKFHYLCDSSCSIHGIKFYGTPWQNVFFNWAYNLPREGKEIKEKFDAIPNDTNVLLTHSPIYDVLDRCPDGFKAGSKMLRKKINKLSALNNLKLINYGHIHNGYGEEDYLGIHVVNSSLVDERYRFVNKPIVFDLDVTSCGKK